MMPEEGGAQAALLALGLCGVVETTTLGIAARAVYKNAQRARMGFWRARPPAPNLLRFLNHSTCVSTAPRRCCAPVPLCP